MALQTIKSRNVGFDILSVVKIKFARDGQAISSPPASVVSASNMPDLSTATALWQSLGKGSNFQVTKDEKTVEVEVCADDGRIVKHKDFMLLGMSFSFLLGEMSPEAYELLFGVAGQIDDGKPAEIGASGAGTIEGWISLGLSRAQSREDKITPITAHGRLHLKTNPQGQSDYAKPEFEFIIDLGNSLNTITALGVQSLNAAI
ncbi:MAG: hypothetical protein RR419_08985 [Akkermansia sp.]